MSPAVWPAVVSVCADGTMASETKGSDVVPVTVKVAVAVTTLPSGFVASAVMTVAPWPTAVMSPPVLVMVATETLLEAQATVLLRSRVPGVEDVGENVPIAIIWLVWPGKATDWLFGVIAIESSGSDATPVTVKFALAVTTDLSGFVQMAVIGVVPWPTAVASPVVAPTVAMPTFVELQATWVVRFT